MTPKNEPQSLPHTVLKANLKETTDLNVEAKPINL